MPFHVDGQAVGTVWVVAHDETRKFDAEDQRLLESLATFAATAYQARSVDYRPGEGQPGFASGNRASASAPKRHCGRPTAARASSWRCWPMNFATLSRRSATRWRSCDGQVATTQKLKPAIEMMQRQVGQMVRLVDDLLDVSRISRGKIELRTEPVELASVVNHAVEAVRPLCESMDHELTVTLPPKPMYLNADPTRLAQVVGNLLNNACKFTERGGRIRLTVEREGKQAVIRVQDTGIGIAAEQLPRIFEMFTQVDTSLERSRDGLGIGLTLVKEAGGNARWHSRSPQRRCRSGQ